MPYIEYKQVLTCSHKKVHSIWESGGWDGRKDDLLTYNIHIMLTDSTRKDFKGTDYEIVKQDAEQYLQQLN